MGFNELPGGHLLAIDDVSFTEEPCKQIPWKQNEGRVDKVPFLMNGFPTDWPYFSFTSGIRQVCCCLSVCLFICLFVGWFFFFFFSFFLSCLLQE